MDKISIVIPCYNEEEALEYFYAEMKKVMKKMKEVAFELLFVDDGSEDQTLAMLRIPDADTCLFPETLGRKQLFMPAFPMPPEIMWQLWMQTFRILPDSFRKCIGCFTGRTGTVWLPEEKTGKESQGCDLFCLTASIK